MKLFKDLNTERLHISALTEEDHLLIVELLNTEGWLKFIGNRNIYSKEDAVTYIQKVNANPHINYWAVTTKTSGEPIGLVTLIQRDYLEQPDIGFAFLPAACGKGYALEASKVLMEKILQDNSIKALHAVTLPANKASISLVTKLGLQFDRSIHIDNEELYLYTYKKDAG